ncbi:3-deoxy-7-phosphoheptulonate synthase [Aquisalimonas sp.]|uniref:3-deoxy-7-phosphoheptulonate synthase n=1 Tax=Aquisalimonas sp. TaxID=1872621 RepID=UPI0025BD7755|nr:3-deoxy-7-phosphoheptulonate synthase [Aquisalimonas sp.]
MRTDDLRIRRARPLLTPAILAEEVPLTDHAAATVTSARGTLEAILDSRDGRLFVVVGPCSIHDTQAALDYAARLKGLADDVADTLFIVMRVYFEKPRTVMGWKGLINDPDIDSSFRINKGLRLARGLLADLAELGLPAGTEFLDTTFGQFYTDLVSWGAIGARTVESQIHRELGSGLSMPVGMKNRTDGNVQAAVDAILAAGERHLFPSLTKEGAPAIMETTGNPYCHLVLRGGTESGPNYDAENVAAALTRLRAAGLPGRLMIDCSHGNSEKDPTRQAAILDNIGQQVAQGQRGITGLMLESHLTAGRQDPAQRPLTYGQSITDACLDFEATRVALLRLAEAVGPPQGGS